MVKFAEGRVGTEGRVRWHLKASCIHGVVIIDHNLGCSKGKECSELRRKEPQPTYTSLGALLRAKCSRMGK